MVEYCKKCKACIAGDTIKMNSFEKVMNYWKENQSLKLKTVSPQSMERGMCNKCYPYKGLYIKCKCGKEFYKFPSQKRKYCSLECYWKYKEIGSPWNIGKKASFETRKKQSISHKKAWDEGRMSHRKKLIGDLNHSKNPQVIAKIRRTHEENGRWVKLSKLTDWEFYKRNVLLYTDRDYVFDLWDGECFYCKKYIKNEPKWSKYEPTVDHKISIIYGFKNKLKEHEIADIDNLCIACRSCNSSKRENVR